MPKLKRRDDEGNTYQTRKLSNGNEYEVIKNFSTTADLEDSFFPLCVDVQVKQTEYFWGVRAVLK